MQGWYNLGMKAGTGTLGKNFDIEYLRLNVAQRLAVDTIEGPVMVVAGPGTGKTQVLTLRIANILKRTDVPPDAILALTFTESAAAHMKRRLVAIVGPAGYRVRIHTFHGFANDCISRFPERFPRLVGARNLGEVEKAGLIEEILDTIKLDKLRPYGGPYHYMGELRRRISDLKRDAITPEDFKARVALEKKKVLEIDDLKHDKGAHKGKVKGVYASVLANFEKDEEFARVYAKYEELLEKRRLYDYEDMILEVVGAMESDEEFKLILAEENQYILADEHQDANGAQNKLLELLSSFFDEPNLFLVGDEKQAIFRFQGASLENFNYFTKRYPAAKLITLTENYRSGQVILDAAFALIGTGGKLMAVSEPTIEPITLLASADRDQELFALAKAMKRYVKQEQKLSEVAVLVRDNADADVVAEYFAKSGVPFTLETDDEVLASPFVKQLLTLLRAVNDFGKDDLLVPLLHAPALGLDPLEVYKAYRESSHRRISLYDLVKAKFPHVYKLLRTWKALEQGAGVLALIERVGEESGILGAALGQSDPTEALGALSGFLEYARGAVERSGDASLKGLIRHMDLIERYKITIKRDRETRGREGVRVMTAHRSKGLEFERVHIVFAEDKHWGGRHSDDAEDERRLFYVALTRAKRSVVISYSREVNHKAVLPTRFITEIDAHLTKIEGEEANGANDIAKLKLTPAKEKSASLQDGEYVRQLFAEQGFSVSALNNYLECPWKYFYQSLLRIPRSPDKYSLFGTAVHASLKDLFNSVKHGQTLPAKSVLNSFEQELAILPLPERDIAELKKKGEKALIGYYKTYQSTWHANVLNEFDVKGVHLDIEDGEPVLLRGRIDKIEIVDGSPSTGSGQVNVVDYKTGRVRSRNELMGQTKTATGNEYRQLLFYKILLDRYQEGKYKVATGEIDFVEPNDRGKWKRESFEIRDEEVKALETLVGEKAGEIRSLAFWNTRCDEKNCEFCALREMMGANSSLG